MSKYEPTTTHIEEEQNLSQEAKHPEEDVEWTKYDTSMGKGMQQEEQATYSTQQGLEQGQEPEADCETKLEAMPTVGVLSPQEKKKARAERSMQGIQHT
jgi:hypothetical protein